MPIPVSLYNTMTRKVEALEPMDPPVVRIYTCGPTVYSHPQLGNYRAYIVQDVLVKVLRYFGYQPDRVMNITDVGHLTSDQDEGEDKLEVGARREGATAWEIAKKYEEIFLGEIAEFHIEKPVRLVRATDRIQDQINLIKELEEKGYTYTIADGVYFDSSKVTDYGKLAHLDIDGLQAGARVEMQEGKKLPTDFALWKFSHQPGERHMEWESPWGIGFPGWHIECSAIALKELGPELDIHCGGVDHIPVHHTNEIAQSEAITGQRLARIWLHNEFLLVDGGRMGKSLGNAYTPLDLKERGYSLLAFRFFTYSASYRSKLNFTWEGMEAAENSYNRLRELVTEALVQSGGQETEPGNDLKSVIERTDQALANDLNMPLAMAVLWEVMRSDMPADQKVAYVRRYEPVFSLGLLEKPEEAVVPEEVLSLVKAREQARAEKDWERADQLRLQIEQHGYTILDGAPGQESRIKATGA